jgi:DNA-binding GntR family transcriptional regulator
VDSDAAA